MRGAALKTILAGGGRVLALGAHPDDIAIGCGGLLRRVVGSRVPGLELHAITYSHGASDDPRGQEETLALADLGFDRVTVCNYRDTELPNAWADIKRELLRYRDQHGPESFALILTHRRDDAHQDHRTIAENTWRVFRDHLVLEYEVPQFEGLIERPNVYFPLSEEEALEKVRFLMRAYPSREGAHTWWTRDNLLGLLRMRGVECNQMFAEGFSAPKLIIG